MSAFKGIRWPLRLFLIWELAQATPCLSRSRESASDREAKAKAEQAAENELRWKQGYAALIESSIPHPVELGFGWLHPKGDSQLFSAGYLRKNLAPGHGVRDITFSMQHLEYRYRTEPWTRHPLFLQIAGGIQQLEINGTKSVIIKQGDIRFATDIAGSLVVRSLYYTPKVGITKHLTNGLSLSWGFGFMIPALVTSDFHSKVPGDPLFDELLQELGSYRDTRRDLEKLGKRLGQVGIPHVDLLEIAYRF